MVFVSRKIAYPFFTAVVLVVFFAVLYLAYFSTALVANISDSSVSIVGDQIVIKIPLENKSYHIINNIVVELSSNKGTTNIPLKGDYNSSFLLPQEKYEFLTNIPLGDSYSYTATIVAPFSRPIVVSIPLDPSTVDPVKAELFLTKNMIVGRTYNYSVKLCNISQSDLTEVIWSEHAESGSFRGTFFDRVIGINRGECQTIYSTLTPIKTGDIQIGFSLMVGAIKKEVNTVIVVSSGSGGDSINENSANENSINENEVDSNIGV